MSNYRRWRVPGATYYFEVCLEDPGSTLLHDRLAALSDAWRETAQNVPFLTEVLVIRPNSIRTIWTLPAGDANFSERWRQIKYRFSRKVPDRTVLRASQFHKRERGLWQRRYWEHVLRNEADLARHTAECLSGLNGSNEAALVYLEPFDAADGLPVVATLDHDRRAA